MPAIERILVVEDSTDLSEALTAYLEEEGFGVTTAPDGVDGLKRAINDHPDLILLDIMLPGLDGVGFMRQLRDSGEWGKNAPVIILTNVQVNDRRVDDVLEELPAYYLVKSDISLKGLVEKIKERLGTV